MSVMRVREKVGEIQSYVVELLMSVWYLEYLAVPIFSCKSSPVEVQSVGNVIACLHAF